MYIRIQNNTIRFRVSLAEAKSLLEGTKLNDSFTVPNQNQLHYSLSASKEDCFQFKSSNHLTLEVNIEKLKEELNARPSKTGIKIDGLQEQTVEVFLQVDIKKK